MRSMPLTDPAVEYKVCVCTDSLNKKCEGSNSKSQGIFVIALIFVNVSIAKFVVG